MCVRLCINVCNITYYILDKAIIYIMALCIYIYIHMYISFSIRLYISVLLNCFSYKSFM